MPPSRGSALAVDWGTAKTGFAVTDPLRIALEPLDPLRVEGSDPALLEHIGALFADRDIGTIVVGLPLNMDGSEGPMAQQVRDFTERLARRFPSVRIALQDERLSSKEADAWMQEIDVPRKRRRELRDSASAMVILRSWLEAGEP